MIKLSFGVAAAAAIAILSIAATGPAQAFKVEIEGIKTDPPSKGGDGADKGAPGGKDSPGTR